MNLLKGSYKTKNQVKKKVITADEELENKFEKNALKRIGGSMVYVNKKKINWSLKE
jgi:hypothetical protein|tara:strand:- start:203 stop:370 length:168 start_codon:yes stop_codon:yes gene_type:complete